MFDTIITKKNEIVKENWQEKKKNSLLIAEKFFAIGLKNRGYSVKFCSTQLVIQKCECGNHYHIKKANLCRDRLCPICQWRLSLKRFADMLHTFEKINIDNYIPFFLTLTLKNCKPAEISETIKKMNLAWRLILNRTLFLENIKGWAKSIEVTYNKKNFTLHPHFHCILLVEKGGKSEQMFLSNKKISSLIKKQWKEALKIDYEPIIDFRKISNKKTGKENKIAEGVLETFKYTIKDKELIDMPLNIFREISAGLSGKRLVAYGGILKSIKAEVIQEELEGIDIKCEKCGSDLIEVVQRWSFGENKYIEEN